ncbi:MAG TPA: SCP2 sterol-binding domain-containing protein [Thermoleophilaceae bacterium]|nr:SCP2 sterol-binding domain-containing protein [Thermoleophilaceae bacterium]
MTEPQPTRAQVAFRQMAALDPDLAAKLVLMSLPVAARRINGEVTYDLTVQGWGTYRVSKQNGSASVEEYPERPDVDRPDPGVDFTMVMDARTLAHMAAGASPARLMLDGRLRIRGKRRRALKLRAMADGELDLAQILSAGAEIDPDLLYRSLEYLIDPAWTKGHRFTVVYDLDGKSWQVEVRDGNRPTVATGRPSGRPDATVHLSMDTFRSLLNGDLTPTEAMQKDLTRVEGKIYPVTLLGRWMERAQGRDDAEMAREQEQRAKQEERIGSWGGARPGDGVAGHKGADGLLDYTDLYAVWERQNWSAHTIDFSVDREQWAITPRESQIHMTWSLGSFYIGEERVTADLVPFVAAAPSGEIEAFLSTQLVDEARHAVFFDRFGSEVMVLEAGDLRGRLKEIEAMMMEPWHRVFDDDLRGIAKRVADRPDDLDLFVEGITTYHMVIEGVLAMTGQHFLLKYMEDHGLYPGFQKGFSMVERDEHRHIAFGVRFLKEMIEQDSRYGDIVLSKVLELVPHAALLFAPPYADSPSDFTSYGYRSEEIYGLAYRSLKRRMGLLGLEIPPASELMPGPVDSDASVASPAQAPTAA